MHLIKTPGIAKALAFVNKGLDSGTWPQGEILPPVRQLAAMAQVSLATMFKALSLLKKEARVSGISQHRLTAGPDTSNKTIPETKQIPSWQIKRNSLESQILSGMYGLQGPLPSIKELQAQYGVCFRTMQKILNALEHDRIIKSFGKGFTLPGFQGKKHHKRIVFITFKDHLKQVSALNNEHTHIANIFENECTKSSISFEIVEVDFYNPRESRATASRLIDTDATVGYILDAWWYSSLVFHDSCLGVLERISRFKKPIAIIDEFGNFELPLQYTHNPLVQVYRIEGSRAGESMARLLLSRGHQSIAYISIMHYAMWSIERFKGIQKQSANAGRADGVHLCVNSLEVHLPYILTVSGMKNEDILQLITPGLTPSQAKDVEKQWLDFKQSSEKPFSSYPRLDATLRSNLEEVSALTRRKVDSCFLEKTIVAARDAAGIRIFEQMTEPLFDQALQQKATAWICSTDSVAFNALEYLERKGKQVPDDISVAGFDNEPVKSLENRLTSFDFNASGFVHRILNFFLHPPKTRGLYRHKAIEVEGMIIERESVGKKTVRSV
jgi:DNA-binding transcriptional regulator YhcF (GntR family)